MLTISVCVGSSCHIKGSYDVIDKLKDCIEDFRLRDKVEVKLSFCLGNCVEAVSVKIGDNIYSVEPYKTEEFFKNTVLSMVDLI